MAYNSAQYLQGRIKYNRPSAMLWSENQGSLVTYNSRNYYVPLGYEINSNLSSVSLSTVSVTGFVATYTVSNSFNAGDYVLISGASQTELNGTFLVSAADGTTFSVILSATSSATTTSATAIALSNFLIISDHNRDPLDFKTNRIEKRERMITGQMRSFWIADKMSLSVSWKDLPSRGYSKNPKFDLTTGISTTSDLPQEYTVDGGAGGSQILDWYENHTGSFYVYLSYDKYNNFTADSGQYSHLKEYSQVMEMYISDFNYTVSKRGGSNYDLWNISLTLEEA